MVGAASDTAVITVTESLCTVTFSNFIFFGEITPPSHYLMISPAAVTHRGFYLFWQTVQIMAAEDPLQILRRVMSSFGDTRPVYAANLGNKLSGHLSSWALLLNLPNAKLSTFLNYAEEHGVVTQHTADGKMWVALVPPPPAPSLQLPTLRPAAAGQSRRRGGGSSQRAGPPGRQAGHFAGPGQSVAMCKGTPTATLPTPALAFTCHCGC